MKDLLTQSPEFSVKTQGASEIFTWVTSQHEIATDPFGDIDGNPSLTLGMMKIEDNLVRAIGTGIKYDPEDYIYELSTTVAPKPPNGGGFSMGGIRDLSEALGLEISSS